MRKIPTLFVRDAEDMRRVTREVHPDCWWVMEGHGTATRKYDGTCVGLLCTDGQQVSTEPLTPSAATVHVAWFVRREVKPGKATPANFIPVQHDAETGKTMGWEPIEQSAYAKVFRDAFENDPRYDGLHGGYPVGTYELVGPKVNGNPEELNYNTLLRHADAAVLTGVPLDYDGLAKWMADLSYEGVVWHHEDGRMAKLKRRDVMG